MTWFANWFNSPYYHILYQNRDEKEAEFFIKNLSSYLKLKQGSKIIDIACGKGRHASFLNTLGFDVVGVDLSPNSIATAKKKENNTLKFAVHDMRDTFQNNQFDVVTNLFTSFGYFEEDKDEQKAINAMANNLKEEGLVIIDFMNVEKVISNLLKSEKKVIDNITFNISRNFKEGYIIKDITIIDNNLTEKHQEKVKALTLSNFSSFITNAGLKIIDIFGNYKLEDFNAKTSDRLILICKK